MDFDKTFLPTDEDRRKLQNELNKIRKDNFAKYGECCRTCANAVFVSESPYHDYLTCKYDGTVVVRHCENGCRCNKYEQNVIW